MWENNEDSTIVDLDSTPTEIVPMGHGASDDDKSLALVMQIAATLTRDPKTLIARATQVGGLLGKRGFYRFPVGGKSIVGESIELAQALATEYGGIAYRVHILSVDYLATGGRKVHLRATVIDLKRGVYAEIDQQVSTSAPSKGFAKDAEQSERWHTMQVQNAASKIVRNVILRVLPHWYTEPALKAALAVDDKSALNGKTLDEARVASEKHMTDEYKFTRLELEAITGSAVEMWATPQLAILRDLARDLNAGRLTAEGVRRATMPDAAPAPTGRAALGVGGNAAS